MRPIAQRILRLGVLPALAAVAINCHPQRIENRAVSRPRAESRGAEMEFDLLPGARSEGVGFEPDGSIDLVIGGTRAVVDDGDVTFARERLASPIFAAVRVAHGWVFIGADGGCFSSESFLGPLRRVGDFPGFQTDYFGTEPSEHSRGRAAIVDRDGVAWTTDGSRPFERMAPSPTTRSVSVLFWDDRHGMMLAEGGIVYFTDTGGSSWRVVPLDGRSVHTIQVWGRTPRLLGEFESSLDASGRPVPYERTGEDEPPSDADVNGGLIAWSYVRANPIATPLLGGMLLRDRGWLTTDGRDPLVLDRTTGAIARDLRGQLYGDPDAGRVWGEGFLWSYDGPHGSTSLGYQPALGVRPQSPAFESSLGMLVLADDGRHAALPCARPSNAGFRSLCVVDDPRGQARSVSLDHAIDGVAGMIESTLIARLAADGSEPHALAWIDTTQGAVREARIVDATGAVVRAGLLDATATRDENVAAIVQVAGEHTPRLAVGSVSSTLTARPAPANVSALAFADERRGVVWGRSLDEMYATIDGGRSWQPMRLPVDGDARSTALDPRSYAGYDPFNWPPPRPLSFCDDVGCLIAGRVVTRGWGAPRFAGAPLLGTREFEPAVATTPPTAAPWLPLAQFDRFRCTSTHTSSRRALPRPRRPHGQVFELRHGSAEVVVSASPVSSRAIRMQAWWRDVAADGAYEAASPAFEAQVSDATRATSEVEYAAALVERGGIVLERCVRAAYDCQTWFVPVNGRAVPLHDSWGRPQHEWGDADGWLVLRPQDEPRIARGELYDIDSSGLLRASRSFSMLRDEPLDTQLLARANDARGVLLGFEGGAGGWWFFPVGPSAPPEPRRVAWEIGTRVGACAASASPTAVRVFVSGGIDLASADIVSEPRAGTPTSASFVLDVGAGPMCVREFRRDEGGHAWVLSARDGGVLEGTDATSTTVSEVHCEAVRP